MTHRNIYHHLVQRCEKIDTPDFIRFEGQSISSSVCKAAYRDHTFCRVTVMPPFVLLKAHDDLLNCCCKVDPRRTFLKASSAYPQHQLVRGAGFQRRGAGAPVVPMTMLAMRS